MQFEPHYFPVAKLSVHVAQLLIIFVAWILEIAVFRSSASIDGRAGWYFALCFLTLPALVFETMTARFPRTRKYANPFALAAVDALYMILWLSAFAAVANWNSTGKCKSGCHLSKAVVGLGVVIWLLFILTTVMSVYAVIYYNREGYLPGLSREPGATQMMDPDKDAFSTVPNDDEYAGLQDTEENETQGYPTAASSSLGEERYDNSAPSYATGPYVPTAAENTGYTAYSGSQQQDIGGRVQFPTARYDNV